MNMYLIKKIISANLDWHKSNLDLLLIFIYICIWKKHVGIWSD